MLGPRIKGSGKVNASSDFLTFLAPCTKGGRLTHAHPGKSFIDGVKTQFDRSQKFWLPTVRTFSDIYQFSEIMSAESEEGRRISVRGHPNRPGVIQRTSASGKNKDGTAKDPCLDDVPHNIALLDIDGIPNVWGLDPANDAILFADRARSLLPGDLAWATCHYTLSSSSRVREVSPKEYRVLPVGVAPQEIRIHLYFWLSTKLDSLALKELLRRVNSAVRVRISEFGAAVPDRPVDYNVSQAHMPAFLAAPKFGAGESDGISDLDRCGLLGGEIDVVNVRTLPKANRAPIKKLNVSGAQKESGLPAIRPPRIPIGPANIVSLAQAAGMLAEFRGVSIHRGAEGRKDWCQNTLFPTRALYELLAIAQDNRTSRRGWEHGVPDGSRDAWMIAMASLAIERMPLNLTDEDVRSRLETVATAAGICADWFKEEWVSLGYDAACVARYRELSDAKGLPTRGHRGEAVLATYGYRRRSLVPLCDATADQVARLNLYSVATDAASTMATRRKAGMITRSDYEAQARKHDVAIHELHRAGLSQNDISARLGIKRGQVVRALQRVPQPGAIVGCAEVAVLIKVAVIVPV